MNALMWEARAPEGKRDELLAWVRAHGVPALRERGCEDLAVYRSADRVVVIAHFAGEPVRLPEPPEELSARPPHQWPFEECSPQ